MTHAGPTVGFTLGKFAPLHAGHVALIETGLAETDRFVVLIYDAPETTPVPLPVRADWIRDLYPTVEVIEGWGGPTEVGDTPAIRAVQEEFILKSLAGRRVTHFYCSEFYGAHVSRALGAVDRRFDPARTAVPVCGTAVRADPVGLRDRLPPRVRWDLLTKIAFVGAPSTGKTTLCQALSERFGEPWVPEYGRAYWEEHAIDRRLSPEQLVEIAVGHRAAEQRLAADARQTLFVDTDASTTRVFADDYHGGALPELDRLAAACAGRYDLTFLCGDEIPFDDTPDRSGVGQRAVFQRRIVADLLRRGRPFVTLRGTPAERVAAVEAVLGRFRKWESLPDRLLAGD
ncbi:AAA family ATPase [Alienimonas californiensis]|uniref:Trifunctional NAD biosynthesis/regulator protein NadR n=1 Tax=Alienimonas californiensis TaxID=2527989 RepID=A0A517P6C7_9PLAN|nr:AAA family ATPase [Alienimonas californiensis]QDT14905.1 Trifunctional NAD biosynthesis/regulator protein NadR [Alienimonas californiensis]